MVAPLAADRSVSICSEVDAAAPLALADEQRVKQVLLNLISNAIKYNREGGRVEVIVEPAGENRVAVRITDTGHGILGEDLERLFSPFERLGAEQTGVEGTGLGLALSRRLAETMGGSLDLVSHVGVGSTFWVELPETESPLAKHDGASELATEVDLDRSRGVLLYIEDNVQNVRLLERILARRPGVRLLSAMQGSLGLELAQQHLPDLILLDLNLPDLPGPQVLARLRAHPRTRDIPVAILSADATPGEIRRMLADGAISYMTKPLDVMKLLELVDEILTPA
jgi:CheY-like chemotaxis protein/anti-sigma regulatory factor (Ser/Thr protein kinase)